MKKTTTSYDILELSLAEVESFLRTALSLDKDYKLTITTDGQPAWDYKTTIKLTKTITETK